MIIGMTGNRRAGKDTAAQALVDIGYENIKFAGPLKTMLRAYLLDLGVDPVRIESYIEGPEKELPTSLFGGKSCRFAMQTLGTEWGRDTISESLWVNACIYKTKQVSNAVIPDVRFQNEIHSLQEIGGKVIRIHRPGAVVDLHPSESLIHRLQPDFEIVNDSTIDKLQLEVLKIVSRL